MRITEFLTKKRVKTSEGNHYRFTHPHIGDLVRYWEQTREGIMPYQPTEDGKMVEKYAVIEHVDEKEGEVVMVKNFYDPFMYEESIAASGGPFETVKLAKLEPTMATRPVRFWHWGDNLPGADMGCYFSLDRPVFDLKKV